MDDKYYELKQDVALLKQSGTLVKFLLPVLSALAFSAGGFAWSSNVKIAILETENKKLMEEIESHNQRIKALAPVIQSVSSDVYDNFVLKETFKPHVDEFNKLLTRVNNHHINHK